MDPIWLGSPNYSMLPGRRILGFVLHDSEGTLDGMTAIFRTAGGVSAHYAIGKNGVRYQYVRDQDVAYHCAAFGNNWSLNRNDPTWLPAGNGRYSAVNQYTLGVELEGHASEGFTPAQYVELGLLLNEKAAEHDFPPTLLPDYGRDARITTHGFLQTDRSDPGPLFDWEALRAAMAQDGDEDMTRVAELEAALQAVTGERDQLNGITTELGKQREALRAEIGGLNSKVGALEQAIEEGGFTTELDDLRAKVDRIRELVAA